MTRPNLTYEEDVEELKWIDYHKLVRKLEDKENFKVQEGSRQCFKTYVDPTYLNISGTKAHEKGEYQQAVDHFDMALAIGEQRAMIFYNRAESHYELKNF